MVPTGTAAFRTRQILETLQEHPGGLARQEIQAAAGLGGVDVQAVRRLLVHLVAEGRARVEGETKARRYFLAGIPLPPVARAGNPVPAPPMIPEAQSRRERTVHPRSQPQPQPVGYQRGFLEAYQPNRTFYLAPETRASLGCAAGAGTAERSPAPPARSRRRVLAELAWDSARLEGGRFSLQDAGRLADRGELPPGLGPRDAQVMLDHWAAVEFLLDSGRALEADPTTVRNLSALLTENLLPDAAEEGLLRTRAATIPGSDYLPPAEPRVIAEAFGQILGTAREIRDPFEQAFFLLVHLAYLHPFPAANAATALLAANIPLLRPGLPPLTFLECPLPALGDGLRAVYEQNQVAPLRDLFVAACGRSASRQAAEEAARSAPDPFRLRFRGEIRALVREVVLGGESATGAGQRIQAFAQARLPREDRAGFTAAVEAELAALHDGNFARYGLRPSEFAAWKARSG